MRFQFRKSKGTKTAAYMISKKRSGVKTVRKPAILLFLALVLACGCDDYSKTSPVFFSRIQKIQDDFNTLEIYQLVDPPTEFICRDKLGVVWRVRFTWDTNYVTYKIFGSHTTQKLEN